MSQDLTTFNPNPRTVTLHVVQSPSAQTQKVVATRHADTVESSSKVAQPRQMSDSEIGVNPQRLNNPRSAWRLMLTMVATYAWIAPHQWEAHDTGPEGSGTKAGQRLGADAHVAGRLGCNARLGSRCPSIMSISSQAFHSSQRSASQEPALKPFIPAASQAFHCIQPSNPTS